MQLLRYENSLVETSVLVVEFSRRVLLIAVQHYVHVLNS
jgi:hypothetical protein